MVSPMYIAEIAPPESRGRLVAVSQFNTVLGILVAYFSNYVIALIFASPGADGTLVAWRWMFGILAVPSVAFFILVLQISESPRWLVKQHRASEALEILRRLGNQDAEQLIGEISESLHEKRSGPTNPSTCPSTAGRFSWPSWWPRSTNCGGLTR